MYQIFPDRFASSGTPRNNIPADRQIHTDWNEIPCWRPDHRGMITNNDYYGGDVNVTGLIVACDLLAQLPTDLRDTLVVLPEVMFNFDKVTLDGVAQAEVVDRIKARGGRVAFATPNPPDLLDAVAAAL
jgi:hypothetical protein